MKFIDEEGQFPGETREEVLGRQSQPCPMCSPGRDHCSVTYILQVYVKLFGFLCLTCHLSVSYASSCEMEVGFPRNHVWVGNLPLDHLLRWRSLLGFDGSFFLSPRHNRSFKTVASFFSLSSKPKKPMCISCYQQLPSPNPPFQKTNPSFI